MRKLTSLFGLVFALVMATACPDHDDGKTRLWLAFGATGLTLVDHEPPPY